MRRSLRQVLLVMVCLCGSASVAAGDSEGHSLEIEGAMVNPDLRVVVRRGGTLVARIDPNPGGDVNPSSFQARLVAADNVLASWGCGSYCTSAALFRPTGEQLASFGTHAVSPSNAVAVAYPAFDAPGFGDVVQVIDLRTGATLHSERSRDAWNACRVRWRPGRAILEPCDGRTRPVRVPIPR